MSYALVALAGVVIGAALALLAVRLARPALDPRASQETGRGRVFSPREPWEPGPHRVTLPPDEEALDELAEDEEPEALAHPGEELPEYR